MTSQHLLQPKSNASDALSTADFVDLVDVNAENHKSLGSSLAGSSRVPTNSKIKSDTSENPDQDQTQHQAQNQTQHQTQHQAQNQTQHQTQHQTNGEGHTRVVTGDYSNILRAISALDQEVQEAVTEAVMEEKKKFIRDHTLIYEFVKNSDTNRTKPVKRAHFINMIYDLVNPNHILSFVIFSTILHILILICFILLIRFIDREQTIRELKETSNLVTSIFRTFWIHIESLGTGISITIIVLAVVTHYLLTIYICHLILHKKYDDEDAISSV